MHNLVEPRLVHKGSEEAPEFAHAAEVLDLNVGQLQTFDDRFEEIHVVPALNQQLLAEGKLIRRRHYRTSM